MTAIHTVIRLVLLAINLRSVGDPRAILICWKRNIFKFGVLFLAASFFFFSKYLEGKQFQLGNQSSSRVWSLYTRACTHTYTPKSVPKVGTIRPLREENCPSTHAWGTPRLPRGTTPSRHRWDISLLPTVWDSNWLAVVAKLWQAMKKSEWKCKRLWTSPQEEMPTLKQLQAFFFSPSTNNLRPKVL